MGVLLSVAAVAMCFASNPTLGTWKLNESKSTLGAGADKNTLVVWEKVDGQNKCTVDGTDAYGKKTHSEWTGKLDGKFYAITGDPQADQRSFKKSNKNTIEMVTQKDGKTIGDGTIRRGRRWKDAHGDKHNDERQGREGHEHVSLRQVVANDSRKTPAPLLRC